jgi:hypothetical protein
MRSANKGVTMPKYQHTDFDQFVSDVIKSHGNRKKVLRERMLEKYKLYSKNISLYIDHNVKYYRDTLLFTSVALEIIRQCGYRIVEKNGMYIFGKGYSKYLTLEKESKRSY